MPARCPPSRDVDRHLVVWAAVYERSTRGGTTDKLDGQSAAGDRGPAGFARRLHLLGRAHRPRGRGFLADDDLDESNGVLERLAPVAARLAGVRPQVQAELDHRLIVHAVTCGAFEDALPRLAGG